MFKKVQIFTFTILSCVLTLNAQEVTVEYQCAQSDAVIHRLKPRFIVNNTGTSSINLSQLRIRYYFSAEGYDESQLSIDYAAMGNAAIKGSFYDEYLEVGFTSSAGSLAPGENTGEIQLRVEKLHHGNYIQSNDYSFEPSYTDYQVHNRVSAHIGTTMIFGSTPPPPPEPTEPPTKDDDWLHSSGGRIVDAQGNHVRLTGINWFGFETNPLGLGGLQSVNWKETFDMLTKLGFNVIRLPLSLEIVLDWKNGGGPQVQFINGLVNPDIDQISSLGLLDKTLEYCQEIGLKLILDMHALGNNDRPALWFNSRYTMNDLINGWKWLVNRYKDNDTVIAVDLYNEPHGQSWLGPNGTAKWDGSSDSNNWPHAAEQIAQAILSINPNLLILVEGIECTPMEGSDYSSNDKYQYYCNWWGGNLREAGKYPVDLGAQSKQVVYSPHDYGPDLYVQPWFKDNFTYQSLAQEAWGPNWFYLVESNTTPILIGEWGGKLGGDNKKWMELLADFIEANDLNFTFWCYNPDSHDTGGIVTADYELDTAKYAIVKPALWQNSSGAFIGLDHEIPLGKHSSNTNISEYYGNSNPTPTETPSPTVDPEFLLGDANSDLAVNIVDALLVAQFYVKIPLTSSFNENAADVNKDNLINIVDALLIAQYYVGLVDL
ncbi:MAG: cellulase family glycosylhydrolase [Spirochaetales bacterium]|nr:cellulase family glycosylhydrolase [Spirochaetales bacterium]